MKLTIDFTKKTGTIKPMHGICQPPMMGLNDTLMHYVAEAGLPYSRLHDVQGMMGANLYVDIPNIFRNFDADVEDPASYDFAFTDVFMDRLTATGCRPVYRLGVTIENYVVTKAYRVFPPADFQKWARICEHIIRHYNEGWADGFHYGIVHWEIWNEPDGSYYPAKPCAMWLGTPQQYYELYVTAAKHLKKCFGDSIKVGGYSSCGFGEFKLVDPNLEGFPGSPVSFAEARVKFAHEFLDYVRKHDAPLDFFSWHKYGSPQDAFEQAGYCRKLLAKYGFDDVEDYLNEWNVCPNLELRGTANAAVQNFAMLLLMQKTRTSMLNFYDARCNSSIYGGMFNPDTWKPYLTYYGFMAFNHAYQLKNEMSSSSDDLKLPVCAAADDKKQIVLIANQYNETVTPTIELTGAKNLHPQISMVNDEYKLTPTGKKLSEDGTLSIPPYTCVEMLFE